MAKKIFSLFSKKKQSSVQSAEMDRIQLQNKFDQKLVFSLKSSSKIPRFRQLKYLSLVLSAKEHTALVWSLVAFVLSALFLIGYQISLRVESAPKQGGEYVEGLIGTLQYINPVLAFANEPDRDLTHLIFSGLMKYQNQELMLDAASRYEISDNASTYTFFLKDNILWHDGNKLTADDIVFTFESIMDPSIASPLFQSFQGVHIRKIDELTVEFRLDQPFAPFPSLMTFGILPKHLWSQTQPQNFKLTELNVKPIGSGPWKFSKLLKDQKTGDLKSYHLERFENFYGTKPYLQFFTFKFFSTIEDALSAINNKTVEGLSYIPKKLLPGIQNKNIAVKTLRQPQVNAIFFNQTKNTLLEDIALRKAMAYGIDKKRIVSEALDNEGTEIHSPILPDFLGYFEGVEKYSYDLAAALSILDKDYPRISYERFFELEKKRLEKIAKDEGSTFSEKVIPSNDLAFYREKSERALRVTLTTVDLPENVKAAEIIKEQWNALGIEVTLEIVAPQQIHQDIIRKKNYEALMYGEIIGYDPDPFPFWHSTQINNPGLNLALFSNKRVDQLIIEARQANSISEREEKYKEFQNIIAEKIPAIFLYNPTYTYILGSKVMGFDNHAIVIPADRFNDLELWYVKTRLLFKK